jgi:hypothetical protein
MLDARIRAVLLTLTLLAVTVGGTSPAFAQAESRIGGHPLEFGVQVGYVDFDSEIRFENDVVYGLSLGAGVVPWLRLGLELSYITTKDRERSTWVSAVTAGIMSRVEPWSASRVSAGGMLGVSFMAFEEDESSDSISEGLDMGVSLRVNLTPQWLLRGDVFWRMQTFRLVPVDENGSETGEREETGYLWSGIFRLGLSHEF